MGGAARLPLDRRGSNAVLTPAGFAALDAAAPSHVESVREHLFDQLSPEQLAQLREICDTLLEHLLPIVSSRRRRVDPDHRAGPGAPRPRPEEDPGRLRARGQRRARTS